MSGVRDPLHTKARIGLLVATATALGLALSLINGRTLTSRKPREGNQP